MSSRGARLRALIDGPGLLRVPGAYDALSARIIESAGFEALFAGGFAAAGSRRGEPDLGQQTLSEYVDHYGRIAQAVSIPLLADADTGFGGPECVRETVRSFERAGIAGLFLEDQTTPKRCGYLPGKTLVSAQEMVAKVEAAIGAREDAAFYIVARTDAVEVEGLDAALERARRYKAAGADAVFVQGADTPAALERFVRDLPGPCFANISQAKGDRACSIDELERAGVDAVIFPSLALFAASAAVERSIAALRNGRALEEIDAALMPLGRYNELVGLQGDDVKAR